MCIILIHAPTILSKKVVLNLELAIETHDLTKNFGTIKAVNKLDLQVKVGSIHGFLGPNGAGKSTTIKMLLGLLKPNKGEIKILEETVRWDNQKTRQKVGYMPELPKFPKHLKAQELLELYGQMYGLQKQKLEKKVPELLDLVGLSGREQSKIGQYSKGMQQRLGIAQAILADPELLVLDEPSIGLDPVGIVEVRDLIKSIAKEGRTIFLSSHLLNEIQQICTDVTIINHGSSLASGTLENVTNSMSKKTILTIEVLNLKEQIVDAIKKMSFVSEISRTKNQLIIQLETQKDVRRQISKTIMQMGGIIIYMVQKGSDLENTFLQLVTKNGGNN
jgi:ABC-2 type transport system ATP-binding protein